MKIAVIDLGTNGFRLYIAETTQRGRYKILLRETRELKLAADGIDKIGEKPFERGVVAMQHFATILKQHDIQSIRVVGTAALRRASNSDSFIQAVKQHTGLEIELISGEREADLIYKGMRQGLPLSDAPVLMIDVGGGSVECIISNREKVFYWKSFDVGVAILKHHFHQNDPISAHEIAAMTAFLAHEMTGLKEKIALYQPKIPVFACGTLDAIVHIQRGRGQWDYHILPLSDFRYYFKNLTFLPEKILLENPDIPTDKVEMLPASMVLMDWLIQQLNPTEIWASAHSMKAGILYELSMSS